MQKWRCSEEPIKSEDLKDLLLDVNERNLSKLKLQVTANLESEAAVIEEPDDSISIEYRDEDEIDDNDADAAIDFLIAALEDETIPAYLLR